MRVYKSYHMRTYYHGMYILEINENPLDHYIECWVKHKEYGVSYLMYCDHNITLTKFCDKVKSMVDYLIECYEKEVKCN